jgi:RNA polymerase sigma-70 factor (ECF subfamily)
MLSRDSGSAIWGVALPSVSLAGADAGAQHGAAAPSEAAAAAKGGEHSGASTTARLSAELPVQWFRLHFDAVYRLVARLGVPRHSVDDVVQEAFIAANRRRADIGEGQERRFLIGIAVRLSSNHRQRAWVRREVIHTEVLEQSVSPLPDAEQMLIEKELRQELAQVLSHLSVAHRAVFVLYELEGFNVPEIAEALGLPVGTVASRLGRARAKFSRVATRLQRVSNSPEGS